MLGWSVVDIPMLVALPILLACSAFFSGSETALFGLTGNERLGLRRSGTLAGRAVDSLLANQRMLLITVLVGNMTINVLYFVVTSVLLMKTQRGVAAQIALAAAFLLAIIALGEVIPKLIAHARRTGFALLAAPPLLTLHSLLGPLRLVLDRLVVAPLSRLTSPSRLPPRLNEQELSALLDLSSSSGVIDEEEQRILQDVINLSQLKVRDVMTPRVRLVAVPAGAPYDDVRAVAARTRLTRLPVYARNIDHVIGLLPVRRYLVEGRNDPGALRRLLEPTGYVPETARLDQLLERFRRTRTQLAVVVDEYGGTAGLVALEDVVEELVGDIAGPGERGPQAPVPIGPGRWRVDGGLSAREWAETFGQRLVSPQVVTLGGLMVATLGRSPQPGDAVDLGNVRLEVERVERSRVLSVIVTLREDARDAAP
jgi:magnesium and cobalt exporter, CNNM family